MPKVIPIRNAEQRQAAQDFLRGTKPKPAESPLEPGRYTGISFPRYLSDPALSHSGVETYLETVGREVVLVPPQKARYRQLHPEPATAAMRLGSLVHALVLEPDDVANRYLCKSKRAAENKMATAKGIEVVPPDRWSKAHRMRDAVMADPEISTYLELSSGREVVYRWDEEIEGVTVACRCRPDFEFGDEIIFDLKTGFDMSDHGFKVRARKYGFDRGAAWYLKGARERGLPFTRYVFACVESVGSHLTRLYEFGPDDLAEAEEVNDAVLRIHTRCLARNEWPGYPAGITVVQKEGRR